MQLPVAFGIVITIVMGGLAIILAERARKRKLISNELARKIVHISHALLIATWPFFTNYLAVIIIEAVSLLTVTVARNLDLFKSLRSVKRLSWGEFFFPVGVIVLALFEPSKWIFLAAMLHFGLADAFAALVGRRFPKTRYSIFGNQKTLAGSLAFYITSFLIVFWLFVLSPLKFTADFLLPTLIFFPLIMTVIESLSPYGSDNFTVPVLAGLVLKALL